MLGKTYRIVSYRNWLLWNIFNWSWNTV